MDPSPPSRRIALCVEYNGSTFSGWQAQANPRVTTVQENLETVLSEIASHPVRVHCAGRTDAGVHATGQVVHFDSFTTRPLKAWVRGANALLCKPVAVRWAHHVTDDFHARFSALSRRYRYLIFNSGARAARMADLVTSHYPPLSAQLMHEAGQMLVGEHDFSSFRGAACQSRTPMRNVMAVQVQRSGDYISIDIEANAFLLHMVRNIAGVLLVIGEGRQVPQWAGQVLAARDRTVAGVTAPPQGLTLVQVRYPGEFGLPENLPETPVFT